MLDRLIALFSGDPETAPLEQEDDSEERLKIATCVLLLEVALADDEFAPEEREQLLNALRDRFSLEADDAEELLDAAHKSRENSIDLWQFTNRINQMCDGPEKIRIIEEVWRIICADKAMDGHEDHIAHRLAKLLNLTHRELIGAKLKVLAEFRG